MRLARVRAGVRFLVGAAGAWVSISPAAAQCNFTIGNTPVIDLGTKTYKSFDGGLYGGGANRAPGGHEAEASKRAQVLAAARTKLVMISVGMSNTTQEFQTFLPLANGLASKNPNLVIVDGAQGGQAADAWNSPDKATWSEVDKRLAAAGTGPKDVRIAWIKQAERGPASLGAFPQHAQVLQMDLEAITRALFVHYPNVELAFLSSRTRACTDTGLNPEPYAYESAFSVRWAIERQIGGAADLNFDAGHGQVVAPLMLWGPYLWAEATARSDGFSWECSDTVNDCTHPAASGRQKVAQQLLQFFTTDPLATPWFLTQAGSADASGPSSADSGAVAPDGPISASDTGKAADGTDGAAAVGEADAAGRNDTSSTAGKAGSGCGCRLFETGASDEPFPWFLIAAAAVPVTRRRRVES